MCWCICFLQKKITEQKTYRNGILATIHFFISCDAIAFVQSTLRDASIRDVACNFLFHRFHLKTKTCRKKHRVRDLHWEYSTCNSFWNVRKRVQSVCRRKCNLLQILSIRYIKGTSQWSTWISIWLSWYYKTEICML